MSALLYLPFVGAAVFAVVIFLWAACRLSGVADDGSEHEAIRLLFPNEGKRRG